jgi:cholesterol transport system auxiliary component
MTRISTLVRTAAAAGMALALGGCISLLPKSKPVRLYRFDLPPVTAAPAAAPAPSGQGAGAAQPDGQAAAGVFWSNGSFEREAAGDGILTTTGERVAYIADARWAAPAEILFDQAVFAAFDRDQGHVRLVSRGAPSATDFVLRVDVRDFETRYEKGLHAAPTVRIRIHATMTRDRQRTLVSDEDFEATAPAGSNRVSAIVAAYDKALGDVLGRLVEWTNQKTAS